MDFIVNFDWAVFKFFESLWNPVLDVIMTIITYLGNAGIFWLLLAVCLLIPKKTRKLGIYAFAGIAITWIFNDLILKEIIQRPRPFNFDGWPETFTYPNLVSKPSSWSFPSGHTASSFGTAIPLLMRMKKKYSIPLVVLAFLIGISRIYVHVHYPTDVIGGIVVGTVCGILSVIFIDKVVYGKIIPKIQARKVK